MATGRSRDVSERLNFHPKCTIKVVDKYEGKAGCVKSECWSLSKPVGLSVTYRLLTSYRSCVLYCVSWTTHMAGPGADDRILLAYLVRG